MEGGSKERAPKKTGSQKIAGGEKVGELKNRWRHKVTADGKCGAVNFGRQSEKRVRQILRASEKNNGLKIRC